MINIEDYGTNKKVCSKAYYPEVIKLKKALKYAHSRYLFKYWVSKRELKVTKKGIPKIFL